MVKYYHYQQLNFINSLRPSDIYMCVGKLTIIGADNGLSPGRRQAIIWTNAGILLIGLLRKNFNEILIGIYIFSLKKTHLKWSSAKWRPFCLGPGCVKKVHHSVNTATSYSSQHNVKGRSQRSDIEAQKDTPYLNGLSVLLLKTHSPLCHFEDLSSYLQMQFSTTSSRIE